MSAENEATPGSQAALRQANQQRVIEAVRSGGTLTQAEIARVTGLSAATVSNIVRDLGSMGIVAVRSTSANGRRARAVTLLRESGAVAAIEFAPGSIEAVVADSAGRVVTGARIAYDTAASPERAVRRGVWLIETVLARARVDRGGLSRVVAAVPGPVSPENGEVGATCVMPRWVGYMPARRIGGRLGVAAVAENDANLCVLAEYQEGVARGIDHVVYVRLSHGVGGAVLVAGELLRGAGGTAGEFGHLSLDERGQVCRCGNRGCLETLAGAPYLVAMAPRPGTADPPGSLRDVVEGARQGDPGCRRIVAEAGAALGRGIAMVATMINPRLVVVGGELAEAGELLLEPLRRSLELGTLSSAATDLQVVQGTVTGAVLRGAVRYGLVQS